MTTTQEQPQQSTRLRDHLDRSHVIAAAVGALLGILGYLAATWLLGVLYHPDAFYDDAYAKGYQIGEGLMTGDLSSEEENMRRQERCGVIAKSFYDESSTRTWTYSGGLAFAAGCAAAVMGKPADPDEAGIYPGDGSI